MILSTLDWIIIGLYLLLSLLIGLYYTKRSNSNTNEFFLGDRKMPWFLAGTSMVATTFAADTPLAVTELVSQNGIAGNWLWWNMLIGGMFTVFFFARLWRRAGIMTDTEFVAIRYSGKEARFLRGFRAFYIGIVMNTIVIAWVNLAMVKILKVIFPELTFFGIKEISFLTFTFSSHLLIVGCLMLLVAFYTSLSGLWGVTVTDAFQFFLAMGGCIVLAIFALDSPQIGGISGLIDKLPAHVFDFTPVIGEGASQTSGILQLTVTTFVTFIAIQWWSSWYPGAEPGGGGYVAQRIMSAKNEKHSVLATLWFQLANYALRPWPWIIVALATMVMYPQLPLANKGEGFIMLIRDLMPSGLLGLMIATFLAAYMSTISSQTVWGTSYIINDFYKPFINKNASEKRYLQVARIATFALIVFSMFVTSKIDRISDAWTFIIECSGGIGLVLILRWFWWRVNAWSEIVAIIAPFVIYPILKHYNIGFPNSLLIITAFSSICWITITFLTKPTENDVLVNFYKKIHPSNKGWKHIATQCMAKPGTARTAAH